MVVGSGLIAKAFVHYTNNDNVIVFASGVSNSKCIDSSEYEREFEMVRSYADTRSLFIYFSTSSIEDPYLSGSRYISHKKEVELYIESSFSNFLIIRLPNVVGTTVNPNTLTNYIFNCIIEGRKIGIQSNAKRYLIDIEDITLYVDKLISISYSLQKKVNLIVSDKLSVIRIVELFEEHLGRRIEKEILFNKGGDYFLSIDPLFEKIGLKKLVEGEVYLRKLLNKYYSFEK